MPSNTLVEAKDRLDRLIAKARAHLYKPIAIAEILYRHRVEGTIDLSEKDDYRRRSYSWMREIVHQLYNKKTATLNSRYWDQTFDPDVLPPELLNVLGEANCSHDGVVEAYIYWHIQDKFAGMADIRDGLESVTPEEFELGRFLSQFEEDPRFRRSVDKAYEIIVYALFNAVTCELGATVSLSIDKQHLGVLSDFEDFSRLILGIDADHPEVTQPARLFRVGTANAADAGLDMWANYGPAVQVKHVSLSADQTGSICDSLQADSVVVVCKDADAKAIGTVLAQIGLSEKLRGIITEKDLTRWYELSCSAKYSETLGVRLLQSIREEMWLEFPLAEAQNIETFLGKRGYDLSELSGEWAVGKS
jgi:HaeII-like restriction endonuclease